MGMRFERSCFTGAIIKSGASLVESFIEEFYQRFDSERDIRGLIAED